MEYSNLCIIKEDEKGVKRNYYYCEMCGKLSIASYGFSVELERHSLYKTARIGLCNKCAKQILPIIADATDNALNKFRELRTPQAEKWEVVDK